MSPCYCSSKGTELSNPSKLNKNDKCFRLGYPIGNKAKAYSVREVIGDKLALTAPDYTRLYLGMSEVEKITDSSVLFELGKVEMI